MARGVALRVGSTDGGGTQQRRRAATLGEAVAGAGAAMRAAASGQLRKADRGEGGRSGAASEQRQDVGCEVEREAGGGRAKMGSRAWRVQGRARAGDEVTASATGGACGRG